MRSGIVARVVIGVIALVVVAWFAVLQRGALATKHATQPINFYGQLHTHAGLRRLEQDVDAAKTLDPDTAPDLILANILYARNEPGGRAHALRIAQSVVRREPENLLAWQRVLTYAIGLHRAGVAAEARTRLRHLDPIDTRAPGVLP